MLVGFIQRQSFRRRTTRDYFGLLIGRLAVVLAACSSVALGLERTGRIITSAALIMVMVCASFALADIVLVKAFGVGLGLAIFIDATLVRAFLVPALMHILGNLNWWAPSFLRGRAKIRITSQVGRGGY